MDLIFIYKAFFHDSLGILEIERIEQSQIRFDSGFLEIYMPDIHNITLNRIKSSNFGTLYAGTGNAWIYRLDIKFAESFGGLIYFKVRLEK